MPLMPDYKTRHQEGNNRQQCVTEEPADADGDGGLGLIAGLTLDDLLLVSALADT